MRKPAPIVALIVTTLVLFGFEAYTRKAPPSRTKTAVILDTTHCPGGEGHASKTGPVICIDVNNLNKANPDHQKVYQGSWIHFYLTVANQNLDINFAEPDKVQFKNRKGNECWVRVRDNAAAGPAPYKATNLSTKKSSDPEVVIEPAPSP